MQISIYIDTNQRYRVYAHVGNVLSRDGVTVTLQLLESAHSSFVFEFWTREDAVAMFRNLALAAEVTTATQGDEDTPGATLMSEAVTTSWDQLKSLWEEQEG